MTFAEQIAHLGRVLSGEFPARANGGARVAHERAMALRKVILKVVESHPGIAAMGVALELNISRETASAHLQAMKKAGLVERRTGYYSGWQVTEGFSWTK
jgi:predicted transcriptional regulator